MEKVFRHISHELDIPRSEWQRALSAANRQFNPSPGQAVDAYGKRVSTVTGIARPELDVRLFAKALINLAEEQASS